MGVLKAWLCSFAERLICKPFRGMRDDRSVGLERGLRYILILLRVLSIQYIVASVGPDDTPEQRRVRDFRVDIAVLVQCILVVLLWGFTATETLAPAKWIAAYLLGCLYVSLANIVVFYDVPSINKPSTSPVRTLLLLAINMLQVTFTFAIFYRAELHLGIKQALFGSFLVLGTLGLPDCAAETYTILVPIHVISNLFLFVFVIAVFVGQVSITFLRDKRPGEE